MHKLIAAFTKEILILFRDIPGLIILFLMPVILILIVTVAQENAEKTMKETRTLLLFADESHSPASKAIEQSLAGSGFFSLIQTVSNHQLDHKSAYDLVMNGDFHYGIIITPHDSAIQLLVDPTLQEAFKNATVSSIHFIIRGTQSRVAIESVLSAFSPEMKDVIDGMIRSSMEKLTPITEVYPSGVTSDLKPSLFQNSIPGFILFAMFFIVIPLSGSIINEKNQGSYNRLRTLPVRVSLLFTSKVIIYVFVCLLQFVLMMLVGMWLLPLLFDLPAFQPGNQYFALFLTTLASALAAIGFGLIVGAASTTHGQAAMFGSVMVVILGIISGSFLPIHLFPKAIQYLSWFSPMRWGIDSYLSVFIRHQSLVSILPNILLLLLFFGFAMIISVYIFAGKK
ncbi:MAG: ABC transporter permease [Bacteroidetes bacterium]|nr:ABC transporter permease [Bacteroidota bacterium]